MARARGKPTPAKKRTASDGRPRSGDRDPRRPARRAAADVAVPRSTQRSALAKGEGPAARPARRDPKLARAITMGGDLPTPPVRPVTTGEDPPPRAVRARRARSLEVAPEALHPPGVRPSPNAASVGELDPLGLAVPFAGEDREPDVPGHVMELHWGDDAPSSRRSEGLVERWVKRGDGLLRHLAEHGAARHEYRADLKEGRFVWIDPEGRVSAEAQAQVLCSWSPSTWSLAMAWADPLLRGSGIARIEGIPAERDDVDEETAWRIAMDAADRASADYLYRVTTPHAWYFLALSALTFRPERASFRPSTPVGLVLRGLAETRRAVESRAEPVDVVRDRLSGLGRALIHEAEYAYRGSDWVARLERTGRRLVSLGQQLPRRSFTSLAAGRAGEWLDRQATIELSDALALLEDEWALFS